MRGLKIVDLSVAANNGQKILHEVSMEFEVGKKYAILGSNGSGKSTLMSALMGHPHYRITGGRILLDGRDITNLSTDEKSRLGLFMGFQYPMEIEGVSFSSFLRSVLANRPEKINFYDVLKDLPDWANELGFKNFNSTRDLNVGFSGGEKKRSEILQMLALKPRFAFLDEPDSGLDVDGLTALTKKLTNLDFPTALVVITHHEKMLAALNPDIIYKMKNGRVC
ncbi:Fe-S cluster assembly ATPase SufC [Candidatus Saccharibacteria bacterium]|nr:Fe-S cluster assembly ATPase SufC [Candidatus Saccharibacteria bacterium]MCL1962958.1 Fe-S cluster assembly ATPase SufC [Candidatus Saccharibacteria bacterium]